MLIPRESDMLLCNADWVVDVSSWWREVCPGPPANPDLAPLLQLAAVATVPCQPYEVMDLCPEERNKR